MSLRFIGLEDGRIECLGLMEGQRSMPVSDDFSAGARWITLSKTHWVTRNRQRVAVVDMTDEHLRNTILYLHRYEHYDVPCLPTMLDEAARRKLLPLKEV